MALSFISFLTRLILELLAPPRAELLFAGDAMMHMAQIEAARGADGSYSYADCFLPLQPIIENADFAVVNLETPLGGKPYRGYPCFSAPDSYAEALRDAGFDLMLTANNHTLDCRDRGLKRTVQMLDSMGINHIGTYPNPKSRLSSIPFIANINGFRVGFLNYTYGTNGIQPQREAVVDYIDRKRISQDIASSRSAGAEIVCVAIHWGEEYQLIPNKSQTDLARFLKKEGADIIFGGHPHVIQPMELTVDSVTGRSTALFYSLGNFISNMKTRDTRGGAIARVILRRDDSGRAYVDSLAYRLIFTVPPTSRNDNFKVQSACDSVAAPWRSHRDAFVNSAIKIFDKYNKNASSW